MSRHFAMCVPSPQASPAADADSGKEEDRLRAELAARVASGPGLWLEELEGLDREGLLEQLLAEGTIGEAAATAPHGHKLDRVLTVKNTLLSLIGGCLFAGQGYDQVLRTVFAMPGLDPVAPGTPVPTGPALSRAGCGPASTWPAGLSSWTRPGPTRNWASASCGTDSRSPRSTAPPPPWRPMTSWPPRSGAPRRKNPVLRIVALVRTATHRWAAAASAATTTGKTPWQMSWSPRWQTAC